MGVKSDKKHVLGYNKIVQSFVQGQWVGVKPDGIFNGQMISQQISHLLQIGY
jgi:hypothetical protein